MRPEDYFGFVLFFGWLAGLCIDRADKSEVMSKQDKVLVAIAALISAHYMVQLCVIFLSP